MGKIIVINGADFSANSLGTVTPSEKVFVNIIPNVMGRGTVSGSGGYDEGDTVQISATAKVGYTFVKWSDGNTNAVRNITAGSQNLTLVAIFAIYEGIVLEASETKDSMQLAYTTAEEVSATQDIYKLVVYNLTNLTSNNSIRVIHDGMTSGARRCNYAFFDESGVLLHYKNLPNNQYVLYSVDDMIDISTLESLPTTLKVSINLSTAEHDGTTAFDEHFLEVRKY